MDGSDDGDCCFPVGGYSPPSPDMEVRKQFPLSDDNFNMAVRDAMICNNDSLWHHYLVAHNAALRATLFEHAQRLAKAETALKSAGYTLKEGAEAWKPPLGPSVSPLLKKLDQQAKELERVKGEFGDLKLRLNCPMRAPSCLVCGQVKPFVIAHLEASSIGVCEECRSASQLLAAMTDERDKWKVESETWRGYFDVADRGQDQLRHQLDEVQSVTTQWLDNELLRKTLHELNKDLAAMTTRFNETVKSFHEAIAREVLALQQLATAQATVKDLERRLCIEKILKHSHYGLRRPMTPEPSQTCLPRLAQILQRLHAIEREKIFLEQELADVQLKIQGTESKTLLTES